MKSDLDPQFKPETYAGLDMVGDSDVTYKPGLRSSLLRGAEITLAGTVFVAAATELLSHTDRAVAEQVQTLVIAGAQGRCAEGYIEYARDMNGDGDKTDEGDWDCAEDPTPNTTTTATATTDATTTTKKKGSTSSSSTTTDAPVTTKKHNDGSTATSGASNSTEADTNSTVRGEPVVDIKDQHIQVIGDKHGLLVLQWPKNDTIKRTATLEDKDSKPGAVIITEHKDSGNGFGGVAERLPDVGIGLTLAGLTLAVKLAMDRGGSRSKRKFSYSR